MSKETPQSVKELPRFGAIDWTVQELPFVEKGPHGGISGMGMVAVDGCSTRWNDVPFVYDAQTNQWMRIDSPLPPGGLFNDPGVCVIGDTIYVAGGEGPGGSHFNYFLRGRIKPNAEAGAAADGERGEEAQNAQPERNSEHAEEAALAKQLAADIGPQRTYKTEPWNAAEIYRPHWPSGMRWRDDVELSTKPQLIDGDFHTALSVFPRSPEDANAFGAAWKHRRIPLNRVVVRYLCVRGRSLEPTLDGQRLEWLDGKTWRKLDADLRVDYQHANRYAPHRGLGYSEWSYTFSPIETRAIRCAVTGVAQSIGSPPGLAVVQFSAGLDPTVAAAKVAGKREVVGRNPPPKHEPELASPGQGAEVQLSAYATVKWPHPVMFDTLEARMPSAGAAVSVKDPEWWDGMRWRAMAATRRRTAEAAVELSFLPRAARGLRVRTPQGPAKSLSVTCSQGASKYFDEVYAAGDDLLTKRLRDEVGEPEFETFQSYLLPIPGYKAAVGRKGHAVEAFVAGGGAVILVEGSQDVEWANQWLAGNNWALAGRERLMDRWFALACGLDEHEFGADRLATHRGLIENGLPGVWTTYQHEGCTFREEVFTTAQAEGVHAVILSVEVKNASPTPKETALCLIMGRGLSDSAWTGAGNDYQLPGPQYASCRLNCRVDADGRTVRREDGEIMVQSDRAGQWGGTEWERVLRIPLRLEPGETQHVRFVLPQVAESATDAARLARIDAGRAKRAFVAEWETILGRGMRIHVPERVLNEAWRNGIGQLLTLFWDDGKLKYGGYWYEMSYNIEDGWPAVALAYAGQNETAAKTLATLCGPITLDRTSYHHQWLNGLAPTHALAGYRLLRDRKYLDATVPYAMAAAEWTIAQTKDDRGKSPRGRGLLPRHVYGGDIHDSACALYVNACCWRGLVSTARLCRYAGRDTLAARYEREARQYHKRLAEVWNEVADRSVDPVFYPMAIEIGDPGSPGYQEVEHTYRHISEHGGSQARRPLGGYWHIILNFVMESGFYPWRSAEATHMMRCSEERGGLKASLLAWYEGKAIDPHYTYGYYRLCVDRGETDKVLAALYGFLAHNAGGEVRTFSEGSSVAPRRTDNAANLDLYQQRRWNWGAATVSDGDEPLTSAAGVMLQLIRFVLLYEETDDMADPNGTLSLLPHAPRRWFRHGEKISVSNAPTCYGTVDLNVESRVGEGEIRATVSGKWREAPKAVRLRLRHPEGMAIRSLAVNGQENARRDGEWVYLPNGARDATIVARY